MGRLLASDKDLTNCSISNAAFLRFSYERSPRERCTNGGRGDSTDTSTGPEDDDDGLLDVVVIVG